MTPLISRAWWRVFEYGFRKRQLVNKSLSAVFHWAANHRYNAHIHVAVFFHHTRPWLERVERVMWSETSAVLRQNRSKNSLGLADLILHAALRLQSLWWALNPHYRMLKYKYNRWPAVLCCSLHHSAAVRVNSITSVLTYLLFSVLKYIGRVEWGLGTPPCAPSPFAALLYSKRFHNL